MDGQDSDSDKGDGANPSCLQARWGCGATWTSRQLIAGLTFRDRQPLMFTFAPKVNLDLPIHPPPNLSLLTVEGSGSTRENPRRRVEHTNHTEKRSPGPEGVPS